VRPEQWRGPLLGHFADKDEWVSRSEVQDVIAGLEGHDIDAEVYVYSGTGHWFANSSSPAAYRPVAADLARHRTIEFLRYHLA
jgi:carboxymethylenebutenolidase